VGMRDDPSVSALLLLPTSKRGSAIVMTISHNFKLQNSQSVNTHAFTV
jgi:hypothetical protein